MPTYTIGYYIDLGHDETRPGLIKAIKAQGPWWRQDNFAWIVVSERSAAQIRDALMPHLGPNDQLFVVREDREVAWAGLGDKGSASAHATPFADNWPRMSQPR